MMHMLLALLVAFPVPPQGGSKSVVSVDGAGPAAPVSAGESFPVTVTLQVKSGYHINAQKPSEDYLIGTKLDLTPPSGVTVSKISYPSAKMASFSFSETPLAVYDGTVTIVATCKSAATLAPGEIAVEGKVTFQACNDQSCLPPSTVDVSAPITITASEQTSGELTLTGVPPGSRVTVDGKSAGRLDASGRYAASKLSTGRHRVRVEADGYEPWEQNVTVDPAHPATVPVSMTASGVAAPQPPAQPAAAEAEPPPQSAASNGATTPSGPVQNGSESRPSTTQRNTLLAGGTAAAVIAIAAAARRRRRRASR